MTAPLHKKTFNRHIDIPLIYLQLKRSRRSLISSHFLTPIQPSTTLPTTIENDDSNMHSIATNDNQAENCQPIRRSRRLQHCRKEREDLKHSFSDEDSKYRVESSKL